MPSLRRRTAVLAGTAVAVAVLLGVAGTTQGPDRSSAAPVPQLAERAAHSPAPQRLSEAIVGIAETVTPAIVRIESEFNSAAGSRTALPPRLEDFFGSPEDDRSRRRPRTAGGSGFIASANGYILTNDHVIRGAERITVTLEDKRTFQATVIGTDPTTDVAVIKIDAAGLPTLPLGDSDAARVGEWVVAIGNPGFGRGNTLDFTVTSGIISAKGRPLNILSRDPANGNAEAARYAIEDFIQTDAVINPGNSGGPLLNLRGEVIGINTAIASGTGFYQGYGFAIPASLARRVMIDLIEHGHVRRALLGITIANVTAEDAEVYGLDRIDGVLVQDFTPDSPASEAGLQRHDVIMAVDGGTVERVGQLQRLIARHRPGDEVELGIIRFGERRAVRVELAEARLPARGPRGGAVPGDGTSEWPNLGIELTELTRAIANRHGFRATSGAVVQRTLPGSPAHRKGVLEGDRIATIDGRDVESAAQALGLLRDARSGDVVSLLLETADGRTRIANIRVP